MWTSAPILPFQLDLHSGGSIPNMLIRVELNLFTLAIYLGVIQAGPRFLGPS